MRRSRGPKPSAAGSGSLTRARGEPTMTAEGIAMRMLRAAVAAVLVVAALLVPAPARTQAASAHTITWDQYSLMIDGSRTFVWSGEFHPFRLPSPSLWVDIMQKMKASGYDAVS